VGEGKCLVTVATSAGLSAAGSRPWPAEPHGLAQKPTSSNPLTSEKNNYRLLV